MRKLLKDMKRSISHYIKNKNLREFYKLYDKWWWYERYKRIDNVKFLSYSFDVPDSSSFIEQFKEIFVDELYKFKCESQKPIIYDCGANIGMSCLYFKKLYPKAKIKAFEADHEIAKILKNNLAKNGALNGVEIINSVVWIYYEGIEFSSEGADCGSIYRNENKIKMKSMRITEYT